MSGNPVEPPPPRRAWALKAALLLFASLLLLAVGTGFWVSSVRDRKWSAMLERVDELASGIEGPEPERLSLDRTLVPGNAWDDYLKAAPYVPGQPIEIIAGKIWPFLARRKDADPAAVEALLSRHSHRIDLISSGARRRNARPPRQKDGSGRTIPLGGGAAQDLSSLCIVRARLLAEDGKTSEALELLIDVCVYGRDVAQTRLGSDGSSGIYTMIRAFHEMRDMIQSREMADADLLKLGRRLQQLDDQFPDTSSDLRNDLLELGELLLREEKDDENHYAIGGVERSRRSWRFFFSSRLQAASTFFAADSIVRKALEARKLSWAEEQDVAQDLWRELDQSYDPIVGSRIRSLLGNQGACQTRAALRLLRFAVHYRATGETLEIEDPFGGKIRWLASEGTLLAWHRTMFGKDDWQPKKGPTDYSVTLTIEVPRR